MEEFAFELEGDRDLAARLVADLDQGHAPDEAEHQPVYTRHVSVKTTDGFHYLDEAQHVDVLLENSLETDWVPACELKAGDVIIMQTAGYKGSSVLGTVKDFVCGQCGELQVQLDIEAQFRPMLLKALKRSGNDVNRLLRKLSRVGVTKETLELWISGHCAVRENMENVVSEIAKITGGEFNDELAKAVCKHLGELRAERSWAGEILHTARVASRTVMRLLNSMVKSCQLVCSRRRYPLRRSLVSRCLSLSCRRRMKRSIGLKKSWQLRNAVTVA